MQGYVPTVPGRSATARPAHGVLARASRTGVPRAVLAEERHEDVVPDRAARRGRGDVP
ncbi:hypothetical protein ABTZ58_25250 [Streptomyces sp. NPDC094143]|uniref:hypothetical protein n=1 Tax=Streptomyces sp. NPDC094143 TaxID=3155310 RepID=UPI003322BB9C